MLGVVYIRVCFHGVLVVQNLNLNLLTYYLFTNRSPHTSGLVFYFDLPTLAILTPFGHPWLQRRPTTAVSSNRSAASSAQPPDHRSVGRDPYSYDKLNVFAQFRFFTALPQYGVLVLMPMTCITPQHVFHNCASSTARSMRSGIFHVSHSMYLACGNPSQCAA